MLFIAFYAKDDQVMCLLCFMCFVLIGSLVCVMFSLAHLLMCHVLIGLLSCNVVISSAAKVARMLQKMCFSHVCFVNTIG